VKDHDILESKYYSLRKVLNAKDYSDKLLMAEAYLVIRQLCHRGMQRENGKGGFNVPFGHGRAFATCLGDEHHVFLNHKVQLMQGDFEACITKAGPNDWIFVDPPYWETQDYNGKGFSEEDHRRLSRVLSQTAAKWLLIHKDCDLYRELYRGYNIEEEDFTYKIHYGKKGADRNHANVKHLYIRNY
jgi:DNA adenine methylase